MPIWARNTDGPLSAAQLSRLFAILRAHALDREDLGTILELEGIPDEPENLTRAQYDLVCDDLIPSFGHL